MNEGPLIFGRQQEGQRDCNLHPLVKFEEGWKHGGRSGQLQRPEKGV